MWRRFGTIPRIDEPNRCNLYIEYISYRETEREGTMSALRSFIEQYIVNRKAQKTKARVKWLLTFSY